jgi:hypothetical protein
MGILRSCCQTRNRVEYPSAAWMLGSKIEDQRLRRPHDSILAAQEADDAHAQ